MKKLSVFLIALNFTAAYAQEKKGYDRLHFSYTLQNYRDKESVKNDGAFPGRVIYPRNADGYYLGLLYERVTAYGLILGAGIQYGKRSYEISLVQDMKGFDPESKNEMSIFSVGGTVSSSANYLGARVQVGYRKAMGDKWAVLAKIGMAQKFFTTASGFKYYMEVEYPTVQGTNKVVPVVFFEENFGRNQGKEEYKASNALMSYEVYLGIERSFTMRYLKNLSIGLEGARGLWIPDHQAFIVHSSPTINQIAKRREFFIDKNISIGLRVGVGLWK